MEAIWNRQQKQFKLDPDNVLRLTLIIAENWQQIKILQGFIVDTDGFMTKLCFGVGDMFVDLTLLNNLAAYNKWNCELLLTDDTPAASG